MLFVQPDFPRHGEWEIVHLATDNESGLRLFFIEQGLEQFEMEFPQAILYPDSTIIPGNWEQNTFPEYPGSTPIEKYLNGKNNIMQPDSPNWTGLLPAITNDEGLFNKLLETTHYNGFSSLQTVISYRNMNMFKQLAQAVITSIPSGLSPEQVKRLDEILSVHNFPSIAEILDQN